MISCISLMQMKSDWGNELPTRTISIDGHLNKTVSSHWLSYLFWTITRLFWTDMFIFLKLRYSSLDKYLWSKLIIQAMKFIIYTCINWDSKIDLFQTAAAVLGVSAAHKTWNEIYELGKRDHSHTCSNTWSTGVVFNPIMMQQGTWYRGIKNRPSLLVSHCF